MTARRTILLVVLMMSLALMAGCQWLGLTAVTGGAYVATGGDQTRAYTLISSQDGAAYVGDAVTTWRERDQLPLPKLAEGPHVFSMTVAPQGVDVKSSLGARKVTLFDNGDPVAEYVVAWDKQPYEYRVVSATNLLYDAPLDVENVPTLPTYSKVLN